MITTDFLLTVDKGEGPVELARTIKMKDELLKERVIEKFEIESVYWERRQIDWGIVTELEIPKEMARNISYIHDYYSLEYFDAFQSLSSKHIEDLAMALLQRFLTSNESVRALTTEFDKDTHMPLGSGITLFYHLIAQKVIQINMQELLNVEQLLRINSLYLDKKYRSLDLLSWCIEVWFSAEYFYEAQRNGTVPYDEPFSPKSIISISGYQKKFPFFLSFDIRNEIRKLFEAKK